MVPRATHASRPWGLREKRPVFQAPENACPIQPPSSWGRGVDRQRVDVGLQQIVDRGVYQPVTRHGRYAAERLGHYGYAEMTVAARGARMTGVQVTLVLDGQQRRHKTALEALTQALLAAGGWLIHTPPVSPAPIARSWSCRSATRSAAS